MTKKPDKDICNEIMLAAVKAAIGNNIDGVKYWLSQLPEDRLSYLQIICVKLADEISHLKKEDEHDR